jgi:hypothetical protein
MGECGGREDNVEGSRTATVTGTVWLEESVFGTFESWKAAMVRERLTKEW